VSVSRKEKREFLEKIRRKCKENWEIRKNRDFVVNRIGME